MDMRTLTKVNGRVLCNLSQAFHLSIVLLILSVGTAAAQAVCRPHDEMLSYLADKYGETPAGYGVSSGGALVELLVSPPDSERQTWSIVVTRPGGPTCFRAGGENWTDLKPVSPDPES